MGKNRWLGGGRKGQKMPNESLANIFLILRSNIMQKFYFHGEGVVLEYVKFTPYLLTMPLGS